MRYVITEDEILKYTTTNIRKQSNSNWQWTNVCSLHLSTFWENKTVPMHARAHRT